MITLNKAQQAAVTASDGPALVLAGAGSGKTRVIIERLVWLVEERGVDPRHLLALTFTNRAAAEMRERLAERLEVDRVATWLGTFHSFALYILRREIQHLGRPRAFTVFDDSDQLSLMKRLVRNLPANYEKVPPRDALGWIGRLKHEVETPDFDVEPEDEEEEVFRRLWSAYHETLERANAVDFDDLLVLLTQLLRDHAEVREKYQRRYQHVLIDEYQDTNRAQYLIARLLSEGHGNLFVVGDEDQSIYAWRGADINNILDFTGDFPTARTFRLEQNYRGTKPILDAANAVVSNNAERLGKTLWTDRKTGSPVRFYQAEDGEDEARFVTEDIAEQGYVPRQVAVLYRTNAQSRLIEEALLKKGLPYIVVGGTKFYARKEIKDVLCYLRLLVNPNDDESLRRVLNVPPRGIGGASLAHIADYAEQRKCSLFQVLRDVDTDGTLPARARNSGGAFVQIIDNLGLGAKSGPVRTIVESLLEQTKYLDFVEKSDEKDFRSRLDNIEEFLAACDTYDREEGKPLLEFLQDMSLLSAADSYTGDASAVALMTCHNTKGLEFDYVYLIGLEEGLLPFGFGDGQNLEEERRLCYVAMTRARKGLVLSAAHSRMLYGKTDDRRRSRFVDEAGLDRLEQVGEKKRKKKKAPKAAVQTSGITSGTYVRHAKFGLGIVIYTSGSGKKLKARIRFNSGRTAVLMVNVAPIEIVEGKTR